MQCNDMEVFQNLHKGFTPQEQPIGMRRRLTVPVLVKVAVLIPTTRPEESRRGPPEFPALIAASVCSPPICHQDAEPAAECCCGTMTDVLFYVVSECNTTVRWHHSYWKEVMISLQHISAMVNEVLNLAQLVLKILQSFEGQNGQVHASFWCACIGSAQTLMTVHIQGQECVCDLMHQRGEQVLLTWIAPYVLVPTGDGMALLTPLTTPAVKVLLYPRGLPTVSNTNPLNAG